MIRKALLLKFLDAAYMQRWNDKIRPVELIELDKQAHKMVVAWFLARVEEDRGTPVSWTRLIEGGIFELFQRIVITDLKPQIFYKIKADTKKYRQMNEWVYGELRPLISPLGKAFCRRYQDHFLDPDDSVERRILTAAHFYATRWEFLIVERANPGGYEIDEIRADLDAKIAGFHDLEGMALLASERRFRNFIDLCGQLRFQSRWAHLHRIPKTSVLGHSLYVAILSYLFSLEIKACPRRCVNNYITGLFHDLPEVLTRDIISPVKRSVEGLSELIKGYEKERMDQEVYVLLPEKWHAEFENVLRARVRELRHGGRGADLGVRRGPAGEVQRGRLQPEGRGAGQARRPPRRLRRGVRGDPQRQHQPGSAVRAGQDRDPGAARPVRRAPLRRDLLRLRLKVPLLASMGIGAGGVAFLCSSTSNARLQ